MTDENAEWEEFVRHTREDAVAKMADSAYVTSICPSADDEPDIKFALETGLAILLDKPIIALVMPGRTVPPGLARVCHAIVDVTDIDMDTQHGRATVAQRLKSVMEELDRG